MTPINQTKAIAYYMKNMGGHTIRMSRLVEKATGKELFATQGVASRKDMYGSMVYSSKFAR